MKKLLVLLVALPLFSCSHGAPANKSEEDAAIARMSENEVGNQLEAVKQQMGELMDRLHTAEARRDQFRNQMSSDANKASAYEGAEAEVEALEGKRGALMHRQHRLEARAREIQGTK